jgi:hypothetical protein
MRMSGSILLDGVSIGGYRSFGNVQRIGPLSKINVFIGPNNCGKSNVLRFIHSHLPALLGELRDTKPWEKLLREVDCHVGSGQVPLTAGVASKLSAPRLQQVRSGTQNRKVVELFDELLQQPEFCFETTMLWHERITSDTGRTSKVQSGDEVTIKNLFNRFRERQNQIHDLWRLIKPGWQGGQLDTWFADIVGFLLTNASTLPPTILIPAVRQITADKSDSKSWCGAGIVDHLAQLQNPSHHEQQKKQLFRAIESLLQDVTGNDAATLEIPYDRKSLIVHMDNKSLPLESLGTGIHELVILAAACTSLEKRCMCIEEPELHLNPILQRKLLRYLFDKTNNQYFITSHSAALLDTEIASVFRVRHDGTETSVSLASAAGHRWQICRDLGYKASDLMQANSVIWVEGPSDRTYLNHWIRSLAPELNEGVHYSIMFYGGRLLSHLSAEDTEIGDFISLSNLNRNPAIIIDRDRDSSDEPINDTKRRVCDEFDKIGAFQWVTAGREIENYISEALLTAALEHLRPGSSGDITYGQFEDVVPENVDKIKLAHAIATDNAEFEVLDLREQMNSLIAYIRTAND